MKAADDAVKLEWNKLEKKGCWDPDEVRSLRDVMAEAIADDKDIHIGSLHELCVEKGSELSVGHINRKYKGRVVFLGDRVRDAYGQAAVFE